jgi:two-component system, sensor histidine kinase and response regulator
MTRTVLLVQISPALADLTLSEDMSDQLLFEHVATISDALAVLKNGGISAVILELLSDFSSLSQLRAAAPDVAILALLKEGEKTKKKRALADGADDVLFKDGTLGFHFAKSILYAIEKKRSQALSARVTEWSFLSKQRDSFLAVVTHDLKNPLVGAGRMHELLLNGQFGELTSKQLEVIATLRKANDSSLKIIENLLSLISFENGSAVILFRELDVKPIIAKCLQELQPTADINNVKLINETAHSNLSAVSADSLAMSHLINNLVHNALKFTPAGGTVRISGSTTGDTVKIVVSDDGPGIPTEEQKNLFQSFERGNRGKKMQGGTGLGLYLCRQIIEAHNGSIHCKSKEGNGAAFIVEIPVASSTTAPAVSYVPTCDFQPQEMGRDDTL